jgi:hypothetical protein
MDCHAVLRRPISSDRRPYLRVPISRFASRHGFLINIPDTLMRSAPSIKVCIMCIMLKENQTGHLARIWRQAGIKHGYQESLCFIRLTFILTSTVAPAAISKEPDFNVREA